MAKAKKLGKGLDEIFGENFSSVLNDINAPADGSQAVKISLDEIRPNPYQPRKTFDREALNDLAASIKEHGVFNPILVRKSVGGYELIAGERRLRASKIAGMRDIPSIVVEFDDTQMMEISILENIQREDLSPLEEARAYEQLIEKLGYTQEKLAERIGKSRPYITNILRLLKLPEEVQDMVNGNKLSYGHARALLSVEDEGKMVEKYPLKRLGKPEDIGEHRRGQWAALNAQMGDQRQRHRQGAASEAGHIIDDRDFLLMVMGQWNSLLLLLYPSDHAGLFQRSRQSIEQH